MAGQTPVVESHRPFSFGYRQPREFVVQINHFSARACACVWRGSRGVCRAAGRLRYSSVCF